MTILTHLWVVGNPELFVPHLVVVLTLLGFAIEPYHRHLAKKLQGTRP
jgi:hypothetical protein